MPSARNKAGTVIAIIGGIFLIIGGGVGMAPLLADLQEIVEDKITDNPTVVLLFKILIILAALGGILVVLGGILIYFEYPRVAKILITLGAGIGLLGLLFGFGMAYSSGDAGSYLNGILSTIAGIGAILAIIAYYLAKKE
ncbi:MAG: hypothetical protein JSV49_10945 [Thermoplasmata archaeon]|nr:MAG: hypothetical protein JSV49_10945 [Thermoplasmata archaeon]